MIRITDKIFILSKQFRLLPNQPRGYTMQHDFRQFITDPSLTNAKRVLKHADKLSAQCVYFNELKQAQAIIDGVK
jgi:hypothetical protein